MQDNKQGNVKIGIRYAHMLSGQSDKSETETETDGHDM